MSHLDAGGESRRTQAHYNYKKFSQLAGTFKRASKGYSVQYRRLAQGFNAWKAALLVLANIALEIGFVAWLFLSATITFSDTNPWINVGIIAILAGIGIVEAFRLFNTISLSVATLVARDPVPVRPAAGSRVAFTTTIVPGKEPFEIVERTLRQARKIRHQGTFDIWLLDEGNDPVVRQACRNLGVRHFSRKGVEKWNTASGQFKAKTKHGNHNAWLDAHGDAYDFVVSVDPDHVPLPNFAERLLGYFRDPNVAFVVGPQVYGNYDNVVTKGAESQAYLFQAAIQRAGNAYKAPMFVGTNHAYRVSTWKQINGFQDSITEDMLTSMVIHSTRNPETGKHWKSVYTPDVVAVGEGPSAWTDFFSQQLRWARGSNEVLVTKFLRLFFRLPAKPRLHYTLMIAYYPSVAISWIVCIFISMLYMMMGTGIEFTGKIWLALYVDVLIAQILLYAWFRKYNVSPHERTGTIGVPGMIFGMIAAPIYVTALSSTLLRRQARFVVTPKGDSASPDTWQTFKKQLLWAGIIVAFLVSSIATGHIYPGAKVWSVLLVAVCLSPIVIWRVATWPETKIRLARSWQVVSSRMVNKTSPKEAES